MFEPKTAFSGFSVNNQEKTRVFYAETLGLKVDDNGMGLQIHLPGGSTVFAYAKEDHKPATFTILNFAVNDIDEAVTELSNRGVEFEHYEGMPQEESGIMRPPKDSNYGPAIAWFKDPSGNVLAVLEN
jgi:predicted enzyme related to lactoylglutathione lyase